MRAPCGRAAIGCADQVQVSTDNEPLPERADQVTVDPSAIATLKAEATIIAPNALGEKAETVAEQACFLPISRSTGSPMLTEMRKGVFFAAGRKSDLASWPAE